MLPNIRCHSLMVARISELLATGLLADRRVRLPDHELCVSGALLHDIAKTPCLNGACDHARTGAEICLDHGYPEIAQIVQEHVILKDHAPARFEQGIFSAREIVFYADKRVRHDVIVSLEERLEYILDRYGGEEEWVHDRIRANFDKCAQLESILFRFLEFSPLQVTEEVKNLNSELATASMPDYGAETNNG